VIQVGLKRLLVEQRIAAITKTVRWAEGNTKRYSTRNTFIDEDDFGERPFFLI